MCPRYEIKSESQVPINIAMGSLYAALTAFHLPNLQSHDMILNEVLRTSLLDYRHLNNSLSEGYDYNLGYSQIQAHVKIYNCTTLTIERVICSLYSGIAYTIGELSAGPQWARPKRNSPNLPAP